MNGGSFEGNHHDTFRFSPVVFYPTAPLSVLGRVENFEAVAAVIPRGEEDVLLPGMAGLFRDGGSVAW